MLAVSKQRSCCLQAAGVLPAEGAAGWSWVQGGKQRCDDWLLRVMLVHLYVLKLGCAVSTDSDGVLGSVGERVCALHRHVSCSCG